MSPSALFEVLRTKLPQEPGERAGAEVEGARRASVLVPLYPEAERIDLVLVQRSENLGAHPGQLAFPGGARDPGEEDLACALREAEEEVGMDSSRVEVLGVLDPCLTITGFLVTPFVARVSTPPASLRPDPGEVARILTFPFDVLARPGCLREAKTPRGMKADFFVHGDEVIWGATARILRQLLEVATGKPLVPQGPVPWDRVRF